MQAGTGWWVVLGRIAGSPTIVSSQGLQSVNRGCMFRTWWNTSHEIFSNCLFPIPNKLTGLSFVFRQATTTTVTYERATHCIRRKTDPFDNSGKWELLNRNLYLYGWSFFGPPTSSQLQEDLFLNMNACL